jgi:O-antigen ligase
MMSTDLRRYELEKAIEYTFEFPVFGVGPGQFSNYEGGHSKYFGTHGSFYRVHNTFLQVFTESGFPGGILLVMSWGSTFLLLNRTYGQAKKRQGCRDIQNTAFYITLALLGFCTPCFS